LYDRYTHGFPPFPLILQRIGSSFRFRVFREGIKDINNASLRTLLCVFAVYFVKFDFVLCIV